MCSSSPAVTEHSRRGRSDASSRRCAVAAGLFFLFIAWRTWSRLAIGVDFRDEGYYALVAQRFALGDRPFLDEVNLRQGFAILTAPFYRLYLTAEGSTDGIILFLRRIWYFMECLVSIGVFFAARAATRSTAIAFLLAAIPMAFMPFAMPAPSYNTIGAGFVLLGAAFLVYSGVRSEDRRSAFAGGVCHSIACIAYPPYIPVVVLETVWAGIVSRRNILPYYLFGFAAAGSLPLVFYGGNVIDGLEAAFDYEKLFTKPRDENKLIMFLASFGLVFPFSSFLPLGFLVIAFLSRTRKRLRRWLFPILALPVIYWFHDMPSTRYMDGPSTLTLHLMAFVAIVSGIFFLVLPPSEHGRKLFFFGWTAGTAAGLLAGFASDNNGVINAGLGFLTASVFGVLRAFVPEARAEMTFSSKATAAVTLATISLVMTQVNAQATYSEHTAAQHSTMVVSGPYKNLWATPAMAEKAESLAKIRKWHVEGERILVYFGYPGVALAVPARPATITSWVDRRSPIEPLLPGYNAARTGRGLAIHIAGVHGRGEILRTLVEDPERLLEDLGWIRIYREPQPPGDGG